MLKLNLKIAWRNLWKNKGYALINILGLSIGKASCILIFLFLHYQLSFDKEFKNEGRIFRVVTDWKYSAFDDYSAGVPIPFVGVAQSEFAGFEKTAAVFKGNNLLRIKDKSGKDLIKSDEDMYYTQPDLFSILGVDWIIGKPATALNQPNSLALSEKFAVKYFGSAQNAIGKDIHIGSKKVFKVNGVFEDISVKSSFPLNIVLSYESYPQKSDNCWDCVSSGNEFLVLVKKDLKASDFNSVLAKFNKRMYADKKIAGNQNNQLEALKDIHFSERYDNFSDSWFGKKEIYGLEIIGLFLLITACINFINLSTAQAINRSKEVGVRKVLGSKRKQLIIQFLTETFIVTLIAMLLACVMAELAIPLMENLFSGRTNFSLFQNSEIFLFMFVMVIVVGFLAGLYPAMIMSGYKPAVAIKNKISLNGSGLSLRKLLVIVQFSISIVLIVSTIVVVKQMQFMHNKSLGFKSSQVLMVSIPSDSLSLIQQNNFKERISSLAGVEMISFCQDPPLSGNVNSSDFTFNGIRNNDFEVRRIKADENYFKLFNLKIIAGKIYAKSDTATGYVVNETFLKKTNIAKPEDAIGKILNSTGQNLPIVGVVEDFNDKSLKENISGLSISAGKTQYWRAAIKISSENVIATTTEIEKIWNATYPNNVYYSFFANDRINGYYETERVMSILFKVFASIIIFISFIGLFGLMSFVATQRTKELAIRKVLGASNFELIKMLNSAFLSMVIIANLVSWPLAFLFVKNWLMGFAYKMDLNVWPFVIAMGITVVLTLIIVTGRSLKAANANPVEALKYE